MLEHLKSLYELVERPFSKLSDYIPVPDTFVMNSRQKKLLNLMSQSLAGIEKDQIGYVLLYNFKYDHQRTITSEEVMSLVKKKLLDEYQKTPDKTLEKDLDRLVELNYLE